MSDTSEPKSQSVPLREVIPKAPFITDVKDYIGARSSDDVLKEIRESHQKYKYIESQIVKRRADLLVKQPEILKCIDSIKLLRAQKEDDNTVVDFSLADQMYARATISNKVDAVNVWLGANVMVEYPLDEAEELLTTQLNACKKQLESCEADYDFIRDQITTTEVSIARIYNYNVSNRSPQTA